jgi:23S rRNA (cytosine1962-C5)-methyltransferase
MATLILHPGKEKSLLRRHPWIFSGAVAQLEGRARPGDTVDVVSAEGRPLGRAAWSPPRRSAPGSGAFDAEETSTMPSSSAAWPLPSRGARPAGARRAAGPAPDPRRIRRPARVIADRYGDTVVLQLSTAGAEKWRGAIADSLLKATGCARIYERSDLEVRKLEGLEPVTGWLHGAAGDERW